MATARPSATAMTAICLRLQSPANRYRLGMWVGIASIVMMFTALSSAYIVRAASSTDWQTLTMPRILLLSTALILLSSGTLEAARQKLKSAGNAGFRPRWLFLNRYAWSRFSGFTAIGVATTRGARESTSPAIRTARFFIC